MGTVLGLLLIVVFLICFAISKTKARQRRPQIVDMICIQCGEVLGISSLELGQARDSAKKRKYQNELGATHVNRLWHFVAVCENCGIEYVQIRNQDTIRDLPGLIAEMAHQKNEYALLMKQRREYWRNILKANE